MKSEKSKSKAPAKKRLSVGEKFLKELREMTYDTSKVGQAFVVMRLRPPAKKVKDENPEHEE